MDLPKQSPSGKIDPKRQLGTGGVYFEDFKLSAQDTSMIMRGSYVLGDNTNIFVTLPRIYVSATTNQNLSILLTARSNFHTYVESFAKVAGYFDSATISTISGFTVSAATGAQNTSGFWFAMGYR